MTRAAPGRYVCVSGECSVAGYPTTRTTCVSCGGATKDRAEAGLQVPPTVSQLTAVDKSADMFSRAVYGGFWTLVTIGAAIVGLAVLAHGSVAGLVFLAVGVVTGLYAWYIFR